MATVQTKIPCIYRFFDAGGVLLYVGYSTSLLSRLHSHRAIPWHREIANISVEHFDTPADAQAAERAAIQAEKPLYNLAETGYERTGEKLEFTNVDLARIDDAANSYVPMSWMSQPLIDREIEQIRHKERCKIEKERTEKYRMEKASIMRASMAKDCRL